MKAQGRIISVVMQTLLRRSLRTAWQSSNAASRSSVRAMASAAPPPPKFYLLEYKYVPDILEKRGPYRAEHLAGAQRQADVGKIVLAGAVGETPEGALFVWKDSTKEAIEAFVAEDPYVKAGLVPSWTIKPYAVVVQPN